MRVLVTGNLGYLGPVIVRHLRDAGHYVIGLDTGWYLPNYAALPDWPDEQHFGDIRGCAALSAADAVVHLAGLSNDPLGALDQDLTYSINIDGTMDVVERSTILSAISARHIFVSSCSVYGANTMATENSRTAPLTAYARSKEKAEDWLMRVVPRTVSLRLGTVYGFSPGHRLDLVVNRMTYDALTGRGITVNGNAARPLVHVEDVARAIVFMLDRPETGIYNVVGDNYHMSALAQVVSALTGATVIHKPAGADARDYMASGAKLAALGWEPRYTVAGSLPVLAEKTLGLSGPPTRYERLAALQRLIDTGALTPDLRRPERIAAA